MFTLVDAWIIQSIQERESAMIEAMRRVDVLIRLNMDCRVYQSEEGAVRCRQLPLSHLLRRARLHDRAMAKTGCRLLQLAAGAFPKLDHQLAELLALLHVFEQPIDGS